MGPPKYRSVDISTPDGIMACSIVEPVSKGPHPCLLVIQEAFGVTDHIIDLAKRFAEEGYCAVVPDLYHRAGRNQTAPYDKLDVVMKLRASATDTTIENDLVATIGYLQSEYAPDSARIGIVGYCMGGRVSFLGAARIPALEASAIYYGGNMTVTREEGPKGFPRLIDEAINISCPVIAFFGKSDHMISPDQVAEIQDSLEAHVKDSEIVTYDGAEHGFMDNDPSRGVYHEFAARDAWDKTLRFFERVFANRE